MTGNEAIDYLTDDTASDLTATDQQLSVITVALDRGYWPDLWELLAYDIAMLKKVDGLGAPIPEYEGSLTDDLEIVASNAIAYLNDNGIVPAAYDHGERDEKAGYGFSTARDGAARGGDAEGAVGREGSMAI